MNVAEWIIVCILSGTLFIFLILGIILLTKLIKISKSAQKIVDKGQNIADRASDIADRADNVVANASNYASVKNIAKNFVKRYNKTKSKKGEEDD